MNPDFTDHAGARNGSPLGKCRIQKLNNRHGIRKKHRVKIISTKKNDIIEGHNVPDILSGKGGEDTISGRASKLCCTNRCLIGFPFCPDGLILRTQ